MSKFLHLISKRSQWRQTLVRVWWHTTSALVDARASKLEAHCTRAGHACVQDRSIHVYMHHHTHMLETKSFGNPSWSETCNSVPITIASNHTWVHPINQVRGLTASYCWSTRSPRFGFPRARTVFGPVRRNANNRSQKITTMLQRCYDSEVC